MSVKVGKLVPAASRRAGGIFPAVSALSRELLSFGYEVRVFAPEDPDIVLDRNSWGTVPLALNGSVGSTSFGYQPSLRRDLRLAELDVLHLHGLWTYSSVASRGWSKMHGRRLVSPHGMLDPWALNNARFKKRVAALLFERRNVNDAALVHALCEQERAAIRDFGYRGPVATIPNGVFLEGKRKNYNIPDWRKRLPEGAKALLFLGRIHPKKGLSELLDAMACWNAPQAEVWHLVIAGWDQMGTAAALAAQAVELGLEARVHFIGPKFNAEKAETLAAADAFILPSFSEGLPMAILEAWAHSLPVLMTDTCNLPEGFRENAAIRLPLQKDRMVDGLNELAFLSERALGRMGSNGRALVERDFCWEEVAHKMGKTYEWLLGSGAAPAFVETS
jgi:poly(glycerol-phosphate) alpha-glucosyltransferase